MIPAKSFTFNWLEHDLEDAHTAHTAFTLNSSPTHFMVPDKSFSARFLYTSFSTY